MTGIYLFKEKLLKKSFVILIVFCLCYVQNFEIEIEESGGGGNVASFNPSLLLNNLIHDLNADQNIQVHKKNHYAHRKHKKHHQIHKQVIETSGPGFSTVEIREFASPDEDGIYLYNIF
jgi:hypothetical protein